MTGHKERLLKYLEKNGKITTILSEYIRQLRADGYVIVNVHKKGTNVFGEKCNYDEFVLQEAKND